MSFLDKLNKGVDKLSQYNAELQKKNEKSQMHGFDKYLQEGEVIEHKWIYVALTNKRVLFLDTKLFAGKKTLSSVPYSKISYVSIQDDGMMSWGRDVVITVGSKNVEIDMVDTAKAYDLFMRLNEKIL